MAITPMVIRPQEVPSAESIQFWSGQEKNFSVRVPYEGVAQEKHAYVDRPRAKHDEDPDWDRTSRETTGEQTGRAPLPRDGGIDDEDTLIEALEGMSITDIKAYIDRNDLDIYITDDMDKGALIDEVVGTLF